PPISTLCPYTTRFRSYNRGMKILNMCGGVTTTIVEDQMQRAPVFVFESSRQARDFSLWLDENMDEIRRQAESASKVAKLLDVERSEEHTSELQSRENL